MRFEWQHHGSTHVHGLAWLSGVPNVEQIVADGADTAKEEPIRYYVDKSVTTLNPAISPDGSNTDEAPPPKTNSHICNQPCAGIEDFNQDLTDLIATCQHTQCSAAYCLRTCDGQPKCRLGYPKQLQPETTLVTEDEELELLTEQNKGLVNSFNPVQLSAWCANVDIQYRVVIAICYKSGQAQPQHPVSVMVQFGCYRGPTLPD